MADDVRKIAATRLDAAKQEVLRLEGFLKTYDEMAKAIRTPSNSLSGAAIAYAQASQHVGQFVQQIGHAMEVGKLSMTESVAGQIIRAHGAPVPSQMLLNELLSRGVEVGGKEPASTLAARLSRAPSLQFIRGAGWTLASAPAPNEKAADPIPNPEEPAAMPETTNDAVERGEVAYDNMMD